MRLNQFISEAGNMGEWMALRKMLEKNCMPYINQLKGVKSLLLRGSKRNIKMFDKIIQRQDRKPLLIGNTLSVMMDDWCYHHWGFRARTQSTFTTTANNTAAMYGGSYIMFPIGEFKYAWNDDVKELYRSYDNFTMFAHHEFKEANKNSTSKAEEITMEDAYALQFRKEIEPELKEYTVNRGLNKYLKKRMWGQYGYSECIVNCKSYYMINREWDTTLLAWYSDKYWNEK